MAADRPEDSGTKERRATDDKAAFGVVLASVQTQQTPEPQRRHAIEGAQTMAPEAKALNASTVPLPSGTTVPAVGLAESGVLQSGQAPSAHMIKPAQPQVFSTAVEQATEGTPTVATGTKATGHALFATGANGKADGENSTKGIIASSPQINAEGNRKLSTKEAGDHARSARFGERSASAQHGRADNDFRRALPEAVAIAEATTQRPDEAPLPRDNGNALRIVSDGYALRQPNQPGASVLAGEASAEIQSELSVTKGEGAARQIAAIAREGHARGAESLVVKLKPPGIGVIILRMTSTPGGGEQARQLHLSVQAVGADAKDLLQRHGNELCQSLGAWDVEIQQNEPVATQNLRFEGQEGPEHQSGHGGQAGRERGKGGEKQGDGHTDSFAEYVTNMVNAEDVIKAS